jgi:uncharacterized protein (DUF2062 family)
MTPMALLPTRRWLSPFLDLLRQGMSPEKIALTIALGSFLGIIPVLGSTVLLCTLAALVFRLNLPAIQAVNGAVYPLQLLLLVPFYKAGASVFRTNPSLLTLRGVAALVHAGLGTAARALLVVTLHALVVWLSVGAIASAVLYAALVPILRRAWIAYARRRELQGSGD